MNVLYVQILRQLPICPSFLACNPLLPTFDNMILVKPGTAEFVPGAVVLYRCQEGFIFPGCGRNYLLCGDDLQWIGNPECIPECEFIDSVAMFFLKILSKKLTMAFMGLYLLKCQI